MPKSKIIKDVVDNRIPLDQSLTRLMVLAKDVNDKELESWAMKELYGYEDTDIIPTYRKVVCGNIRYSGINGSFQITKLPLPQSLIGEDFYEAASKVTIYDGIKTVISYAVTEKPITRDLTILAGNIAKATGGEVVCTSIEQVLPNAVFYGICEQVKSRIINALYDLEKKYGILDDLTISTESTKRQEKDRPVANINLYAEKKEPWVSKFAGKFIIPIITAVIGAVVAAFIIKCAGL